MPVRNGHKNKDIEMEKSIFPILVVNNSNLKPYIEVFDYHPENIVQNPLGILTGFFEVRDYGEDSAYVVNFLNSVTKKEYYANPKRPVEESFDSTLHKLNIALSEIAKHGSVGWLGKIDSALCALEKNALHFTSTGNAKILLWRKDVLTDITEGLSPEEQEPHPLKTFINVSSGRLEKGDRIIITSGDIFNILSTSDIEKNLLRFSKEKFCQFLKTAMTNELDLAGVIIIDVNEPEKVVIHKTTEHFEEKKEAINVFSGKSFKKKKGSPVSNIKSDTIDNISSLGNNEYTDNKTGHIYVQGDENENKSSVFDEQLQIVKDVLHDSLHSLKDATKKQSVLGWKKIKGSAITTIQKMQQSRQAYKKELLLKKLPQNNDHIENERINEAPTDKVTFKKIPKEKSSAQHSHYSQEETGSFSFMDFFYSTLFKIKLWIKKTRIQLRSKNLSFNSKESDAAQKNPILPNTEKIRNIFTRLTKKQKIFALLVLFIIVIGPVILSSTRNESTSQPEAPLPEPIKPSEEDRLSLEKNISFIDQVEKISDSEKGIALFNSGQDLYEIRKNGIWIYSDQNRDYFSWSEEYGECTNAAYMEDLGLLFIITNKGKLLSFSPAKNVSKEFKENSIILPENSSNKLIGTYLTYLYVADKDNSRIDRYPRAEGGFGAGVSWLKESSDLSMASHMSISENLYLSAETTMYEFFQGKKTSFSPEKSATPINFNLVYANTDAENIYVLDKANSRIIKFSKSGEIIKQYHHESISSVLSFSINESTKKAYMITPTELDSLPLD